jgi:hypothetical protein
MTRVIMHTRETFDENCDPRQGPQIRTEAVSPRSFAFLCVSAVSLYFWLRPCRARICRKDRP